MRGRQQGFALLIAVGVVALATVTAVALVANLGGWVRRSELQTQQMQARELARVGVEWARSMLFEDRRLSDIDHAGEPWALKLAPVAVESGHLSGFALDQQGLFNLNNLLRGGGADTAQLAGFRRLLGVLDLPSGLADALADWLDADGDVRSPAGAEDAHYQALDVPYLAGNRVLVDVDELALIRGFDAAVRARLRPFVSALPTSTRLNVNTAPAEVLVTLAEGMRLDEARAIEAARTAAYFRNTAEFLARVPPRLTVSIADISVSSDYFLVHLRADLGEVEARATALLLREAGRWPIVVWRRPA